MNGWLMTAVILFQSLNWHYRPAAVLQTVTKRYSPERISHPSPTKLAFVDNIQPERNIMKIALVLISFLAIGALVFGGCAHRYKTPEQRADHFTQKITKKLDLNDEQKARLNTLKDEIFTVRKEMQGNREMTRNIVRNLLNAPKLDQDKAVAIVNGHVKDINVQAPRVIAALGGFWDSLNPEQQAKVREKMEKHFEGHSRWGHGNRHHM
jgi:Spy/CpxP family protein refolding chaperone